MLGWEFLEIFGKIDKEVYQGLKNDKNGRY